MTSADYDKARKWTPLPRSLRKWEGKHVPTSLSPARLPPLATPRADLVRTEDNDFALEASYRDVSASSQLERPDAPRLAQDHVWGVRDDWGPRTKAGACSEKAHRLVAVRLFCMFIWPNLYEALRESGIQMTSIFPGSGATKLQALRNPTLDQTLSTYIINESRSPILRQSIITI